MFCYSYHWSSFLRLGELECFKRNTWGWSEWGDSSHIYCVRMLGVGFASGAFLAKVEGWLSSLSEQRLPPHSCWLKCPFPSSSLSFLLPLYLSVTASLCMQTQRTKNEFLFVFNILSSWFWESFPLSTCLKACHIMTDDCLCLTCCWIF